MQSYLLAFLILCSAVGISLAQGQYIPENLAKTQATPSPKLTGAEVQPDMQLAIPEFVNPRVDEEVILGFTVYDLQSNGASCNRISMLPDGRIAGTWTRGLMEAGFYPDRGTGYNTRIGFSWDDFPTERIESERTGWSNHVFTASGKEAVVAHTFETNELLLSRRNSPTDSWTESYIPNNSEGGLLWPRMAVGGADGESLHVIAVTTPTDGDLGGMVYEGVNGHLLYYRSTDGGESWDRTNVIIPGLDSVFTIGSTSDAYYIDARGDNIAFAVFNSFDDILFFKSTDNGDTWTKTIINDFPLFKYQVNGGEGYTIDQLPPFMDERPDSLAIFSSDNYGTLVLDNDGQAHVFFGRMFIQDTDQSDAGSTFFPFTDGIAYWNESFGENNFQTVPVAIAPDQNGNDTLDIAAIENLGAYTASLSSMPTAGVDADNNVYLAYSTVMEDKIIDNNGAPQHYRHVWVTATTDGGATWLPPYDIINEETVSELDLVDFVEAVYPSMVRDVDGSIRLIYQQDFQPGISVAGDEDFAGDNAISYVQIPVDVLGIVQTEELVEPETFGLTLAPNIISSQTQARFELPQAANVSFELVNVHGQPLQSWPQGKLPAGPHQIDVDLSAMPNALYYLVLRSDQQKAAVPVLKQ